MLSRCPAPTPQLSGRRKEAGRSPWRVAGWSGWMLAAALGSAPPGQSATAPGPEVVVEPDGVRIHVVVPEPVFREVPGTGDVDVSIEGWGTPEETGGPSLPLRSWLVGVPEGAQLRLEVVPGPSRFFPGARPSPVPERRIEDRGDLEVPAQSETRIKNPAAYAAASSGELASIGGTGRLRHLSVATIEVRPFRWDPAANGVRMIESMDLILRWDLPAEPSALRARVSPGADHPSWERTYTRAVLNWDQARAFLTSPAGWRSRALGERSGAGTQPAVRVTVQKTGIYRVDQESLPSGWAVGNVPVDQIVLEERAFDETAADPFLRVDVPIVVMDYDEDGLFSAGDAIFFFGQTAWDRLDPAAYDRRYGRRFHYFLTTHPEGGARMEGAPSTLHRTDLGAESLFVATERLEGDGAYMKSQSVFESASPLANGVTNIEVEHFYWIGGPPGTYPVTFDLPGFVRGLGLEMGLQGILTPVSPVSTANPVMSIGPDGGEVFLPAVPVPVKATVLYTQGEDVVSALPLTQAGNRLTMRLPDDAYGCALDYMTWTYERDYRSYQNLAGFHTSGLAGPRQFVLTGFSSRDLLAFDVTDSSLPVQLSLEETQVVTAAGKSRAILQFDLLAEAPRQFMVLEASAALTPAALALTSARDLTTDPDVGGPLDLIIVTHPSFWTPVAGNPLERLAERRRTNGLRVGIVTTEEIFDQFGGGRSWPVSIRNYLRYRFRSEDADPTYVLLVGDSSEDQPQVLDESDVDYVPAPMLFANARSTQGYELVPSDAWYVDNLTGTGERLDFFLDLHLGRLPVGDLEELETVVSKILNYEQYRDADSWRNRGLFMADDEFSSQISFGPDYQWRGDGNRENPRTGESVFRYAGRNSRRIIHEDAGFRDFGIDSFFVATYLDTVACLDRCVPVNDPLPPDCQDWQCPINSGGDVTAFNRARISEEENREFSTGPGQLPQKLWAAMSRGHLFVMFQSHANWALASHEYVWRDAPFTGRNDSQQLTNVEKPFLFFGFGCHMAEFSHYFEAAARRGDCMSEKMLFLENGRGAVAACASVGFEWLGENANYQLALLRSWFQFPPIGPDGRTQWVLGDLIDGGKVQLLAELNSPNNQGMVATYVMLGDPSMPVDLAAPRIDRVEVDGVAWTLGQPLQAPAEGDSAEIAVWLRDEVWIRSVTVTEGGLPVDPGRYLIEADPAHPDDDRYRILRYRAGLDVPIEDYAIVVSGVDRVGRTRAADFPVTLEEAFEVQIGDEWQELRAGDFVQPDDSIRVSITSPIDLEADDLALELAQARLEGVRARSSDDRRWTLLAVVPLEVAQGPQTLGVTVAQQSGGGTARREISINGSSASADVELLSLFNFPNPFEDETRFLYTLNAPANRAQISVFTLRGRKIFSAEGRARAGENAVIWDGRDADGDPVANGVYFYKLEVEAPGGKKVTKIDRLARVR